MNMAHQNNWLNVHKPSNGQHSFVFCPPGNLKECIDWLLRFTNKDAQGGGDKSDAVKTVARELLKLFKDAKRRIFYGEYRNVLVTVVKEVEDRDSKYGDSGSNLGVRSPLSTNLATYIGYKYGSGGRAGSSITWTADDVR
ncbi:uncharacterized protein BXIN_1557 [Babesia sp. Xinjiang]|uniref:uncharacterized protein n=1 Tax=Babesia sp. Xinjiang TaxID=462227 RepID=UPI000A250F15|nr:uncharacterized protein BXIN_1557 [Babesia sp. Xinjiang]ORM42318.1 hypothetical protein BXIN_1557 [Babesia sp. Xinjiang]